MSGNDDAGPSQNKRARLQRSTKTTRALTQKELVTIFDEEDDLVPSSESEYELSHSSESDSDQDEGVEQVLQPTTVNHRPTITPTPTPITDWANEAVGPNEMKNFDFTKRQGLLVPTPGNSPIDRAVFRGVHVVPAQRRPIKGAAASRLPK